MKMNGDIEIHGTLENWSYYFGETILGFIHGDTKLRFPDGSLVSTSKVIKRHGDIVYTRNSVYKLGAKAVTKENEYGT